MSLGAASGKMRLFVAAEIPAAQLLAVQVAIESLKGEISGARWTEPELQHVTLKFLGSIDAAAAPKVAEASASVTAEFRRAEVSLGGFDAFPTRRRARVLWVGLEDPAGVTSRLAARLDGAFQHLGVAAEDRRFTPHVTVARLKPPQDLRSLPEVAVEADPFDIAQITLFRSHLGRGGARYEVMQRFRLA